MHDGSRLLEKDKTNSSIAVAENKYDVKRYTQLLAKCCTTVTYLIPSNPNFFIVNWRTKLIDSSPSESLSISNPC